MPAQASEDRGSFSRLALRDNRIYRWKRGVAIGLITVGFAVLGAPVLRDWMGGWQSVQWQDARAPVVERLESRLAAVEWENTLMRDVAGLTVLLLGLLCLRPGVLFENTVEAHRLVLRDRAGRLRVGLTPDAGLVFLDGNQHPRVELSAQGVNSGLKLFDATRKRRIELSQVDDGAVIAISDATEGARVALLGVSQDGTSLSLVNGCSVASLGATNDKPGLVVLHSKSGRGSVEVTPLGPRFVLADAAANPVVALGETGEETVTPGQGSKNTPENGAAVSPAGSTPAGDGERARGQTAELDRYKAA